MRKIVSLFLILLLASASHAEIYKGAVSIDVIEPQWSDVCTYSKYWNIDVNKNYKKPEKQYWQSRKIQFNKEIAACRAINENKQDCYNAILEREKERTLAWQTTFKDERNQRTIKTAGTVGVLGIIGLIATKILDILY